jgi:hypothetical protein
MLNMKASLSAVIVEAPHRSNFMLTSALHADTAANHFSGFAVTALCFI